MTQYSNKISLNSQKADKLDKLSEIFLILAKNNAYNEQGQIRKPDGSFSKTSNVVDLALNYISGNVLESDLQLFVELIGTPTIMKQSNTTVPKSIKYKAPSIPQHKPQAVSNFSPQSPSHVSRMAAMFPTPPNSSPSQTLRRRRLAANFSATQSMPKLSPMAASTPKSSRIAANFSSPPVLSPNTPSRMATKLASPQNVNISNPTWIIPENE